MSDFLIGESFTSVYPARLIMRFVSFPVFLLFMATIAMTMSGCAAPSRNPEPGIQTAVDEAFSFDASSALPSGSSDHFQTGLSAKLDTPVADYQSDYSVTTGALVQSMADLDGDSVTMPMEVARQTVRQAVRMDLPTTFEAPVKMEFDWSHDRRLRLDGEKRSESSRARFSWQPTPLLLEMEWTAPRRFATAGTPLDCTANGHLRMPFPMASRGNHLAMDISRRECLIRASSRGVNGLSMQSHGLSVFLDEDLKSFFRLQQMTLDESYSAEYQDRSSLEIALNRSQTWRGWNMQADVAWRQANLPVETGPPDHKAWWSVDLMLSRKLELVAMTARWMRARDPLWFVPTATTIGTNRLSMLLDFSAWISAYVPRLNPSLSASWERREDAQGADDDRIRWDFSVRW